MTTNPADAASLLGSVSPSALALLAGLAGVFFALSYKIGRLHGRLDEVESDLRDLCRAEAQCVVAAALPGVIEGARSAARAEATQEVTAAVVVIGRRLEMLERRDRGRPAPVTHPVLLQASFPESEEN